MSDKKIIDLVSALEFSSILLDENSREFNERVKAEAERRYRSRHMAELNKARYTIEQNGFDHGLKEGMEIGEDNTRIWYFCSVCGGKINMGPNRDDHKALIRYMKEHGWHHGDCVIRS